jgi:hypothetical protein
MDLHTEGNRHGALLASTNQSLSAAAAQSASSTPRPGEVWRAKWDDVLSLVFVDAVVDGARNLLRVAPVSIGVDEADSSAILLPENSNSLSVALSIWPELVTEIAEVVLERWITGVVHPYVSLAAIEHAAAEGNLRRGLPVLNVRSSRNQDTFVRELAMDVLSLAANVPSGNGSLGVLLAGTVASTIAEIIEVEPRIALKVLRGEAFIDRTQAERLGAAFQRDPNELLESNPAVPEGLTKAMTALHRGHSIRTLAQQQQITDSQAFSTAMRGSYALAARGENPGQRDWEGRVTRYFETSLSA